MMAVLQKKKSGENSFHFLKIHIEDHFMLIQRMEN